MGNYLDIYYNTNLATAQLATSEVQCCLSILEFNVAVVTAMHQKLTTKFRVNLFAMHSANCRVYITSKSLRCRRIHHCHRYYFA